MKRIVLLLAAILLAAGIHPVSAQQNEIAVLRAELAKQQVIIAQLLTRIEAIEKQPPPSAASIQDLQDDIKAQEDSVSSLRETVNSKVNLNGYYNFRFSADGSEEPWAFQQHHLGVLMSKQLGKFNFLMELELQNVPHHAEIAVEPEEPEEHTEDEVVSDLSGEGQVAVENAWMEYNHNRFLSVRVGKQLSPQYWWQNHYPNLTLSTTLPIYLRELFPAELIGVTVQGSTATPVGTSEFGVGYKFYVANNNFEGNSRTDLEDGKSWGARGQVHFPTGGALRRFDAAVDVYRGNVGTTNNELAEDNVVGFETQLELSQFLFQSEWARGKSLGQTRTGYYLQPAYRIDEDWIAFYRLEQLESPRIAQAERRHLAGVNFRPYPQIALKGELYRSQPLDRDFVHTDGDEHKPFNGFATAAVFFFLIPVARRLLTAALIVLMWTGHASTEITPFVVIVNNANPVTSLTQVELRRIFMKQSRMWPHGEPMVPVDWDSTHYLRAVFSKDVLNRSVREMAEYWVQQSMTQGLTPPSTQRSARAVMRFVAGVPGAISYVPPSEADETVRVVPVQ